jgi:mono/diheme cytochrome c family protein
MLLHRLLPSGIAVLAASWVFTTGAGEGAEWYTREQAAKGHLQYAAKCGVCHDADLKGGGAPS